MKKVKLID